MWATGSCGVWVVYALPSISSCNSHLLFATAIGAAIGLLNILHMDIEDKGEVRCCELHEAPRRPIRHPCEVRNQHLNW